MANLPMSVSRAYYMGVLTVNAPVLLIMLGLYEAECYIMDRYRPNFEGDIAIIAFLAVLAVVPFTCAWIYWSFAIPRWKFWAYSRVENVSALKRRAIGRLIWPDGHFLERTELCSREMRRQILELEGRL